MSKSVKVLLVGLFVFMFGVITNAKENPYYVNEHGVELDQYEYVFLQNFYFDRYPEYITQEQYDEMVKYDFFNGIVEKVTYDEPSSNDDDPNGSRSPYHNTTGKQLVIEKICNSTCLVNLQATWHYVPNVKSYDDIGFYFIGTSMVSHLSTVVGSSTEYQTFNNIISYGNGWGNTVKLPQTGTNYTVSTSAIMNTGGHVYGSYQHAVEDTTISVAQNYSFSTGGYGHVFLFGNSATNVYDGMGGVDIAL
ncbi:MAG: hypothetical protein IKE70_01295 [Bacilli bacterium]|nr:hypothetical protein [Bacilli bacterium]